MALKKKFVCPECGKRCFALCAPGVVVTWAAKGSDLIGYRCNDCYVKWDNARYREEWDRDYLRCLTVTTRPQ